MNASLGMNAGRSLVVAGLLLMCGSAVAQDRLPDPPPAQPDGPPMPEKAMNLADFVAAYKRAGNPHLLIYTDLVGGAGGTAKNLNDAGVVTRLGARLEDLFHDPEVQIVNLGAMEALTDQQMEAVRKNDSLSAAKTLAKSAGADVVLYVRMIEQPGKGGYTGTYVLADMRRGTSLGRFAWDMVPGSNGEFDSARMTEYARAIARRAIDQFSEAFPAGGGMANMRRFVVRVIGAYQDDDLTEFRDSLNASKGVRPGSVTLRSEDKVENSKVATFELAYSGDLIDLRRLTRKAAIDGMAMDAELIDSREGAIGLKLAPLTLGDRERKLTGGPRSARNAFERDRVLQAYAKAGKPTIGVVFNRPTVETEEGLAGKDTGAPVQSGDGVNIIVGERVKVGQGGVSSGFAERLLDREIRDERAGRHEDAAIDLRVFEDKIAERLLQLGIQPRDVAAAQVTLSGSAEFKDRKWTDRELAFALGKAANVDVVLSGVGRVVRDAGGKGQRVVLSMRAYTVSTGDMIAATSVQRSMSSDGQSFAQAVEELSAEATAKLATQLVDRWEAAK